MTIEGTFLGFDFGTKRLGIAVGQSITKTARPLIILSVHKGIPNWDELGKIVHEWLPKGLIVGLALQPDGSHSQTSLKAEKLGRQLEHHFNLPVYYIEERLTSVAAKERAKETSSSILMHRDLDAVAAAIILESWFNSTQRKF
ncbi:MAG: Holliday junction resolvase RuvX [Gammaproteobacteria bacterium]|nr:Holliday junction resolvase RuvX [Gammaproteobacteria bacterium]